MDELNYFCENKRTSPYYNGKCAACNRRISSESPAYDLYFPMENKVRSVCEKCYLEAKEKSENKRKISSQEG